MSKTFSHGVVAPGNVNENQLNPGSSGGDSILIKAPSTNLGIARIGKKTKTSEAEGGFPLEPGDAITLDLSDALNLWYRVGNAADKLNWIAVAA